MLENVLRSTGILRCEGQNVTVCIFHGDSPSLHAAGPNFELKTKRSQSIERKLIFDPSLPLVEKLTLLLQSDVDSLLVIGSDNVCPILAYDSCE